MKRAIIYARYSPRPEDRINDLGEGSCDKQITACLALAEAKRWRTDPAWIFRDDNVSGGKWDGKALWDAIHALRQGDILVVANFERVARDHLLAGLIEFYVYDRGAKIVSVESGELEDTPASRFLKRVLYAKAEMDRELTQDRTKASFARKLAAGVWRSTRIPYGWRRTNYPHVEPDPAQQVQVSRIRKLFEAGLRERAIARELNDEGCSWKDGTPWTGLRVRSVLKRLGLARSARRQRNLPAPEAFRGRAGS
jgi:DNA invertase Pin-like site-specific DNA recombinase